MTWAARTTALVLALGARVAAAAPGRCPLPFGPGEHLVYEIEYLGITAGTVDITLGSVAQRDGHNILPIVAFANTRSAFILYPIHDKFVSYLDLDTLRTTGDVLQASEGTRHWRQQMRFDHDGGHLFIHRAGRDGEEESVSLPLAPGAVDVSGMILALRTHPLAPGQSFGFPVSTDTQGFELKLAVGNRTTAESDALGPRAVFETALTTRFNGRLGTKNAMTVLFTADAARIPILASAEFLLGHMVARLIAYQPGAPASGRCDGPELSSRAPAG